MTLVEKGKDPDLWGLGIADPRFRALHSYMTLRLAAPRAMGPELGPSVANMVRAISGRISTTADIAWRSKRCCNAKLEASISALCTDVQPRGTHAEVLDLKVRDVRTDPFRYAYMARAMRQVRCSSTCTERSSRDSVSGIYLRSGAKCHVDAPNLAGERVYPIHRGAPTCSSGSGLRDGQPVAVAMLRSTPRRATANRPRPQRLNTDHR